MLTKVWHQHRSILIIKWIRWPVVWISVGLFPQSLLLSPSELMNKVAAVAKDGDIAWAQQERLPLTKADLAIAIVECLICQKQRSTNEPLIWHCFPGWSVNLWQVITMNCSHDGRTTLCSYWNKQVFWFSFVISTCNASAKTAIHGLTKCLILHHGMSYIIASDQGDHFTAKKMQ